MRKSRKLFWPFIGIQELNAMKSELERLVHRCRGDERPDCPILETLGAA